MKRTKSEYRKRIHNRIRKKVVGTADVPRLAVFRSNSQIYVQAIDDTVGATLVSASTLEKGFKDTKLSGSNVQSAERIGDYIGKRLLDKGIKQAVFDRGGYAYHGRIKAVAEGARKAGLTI